MVFFTFLSMVFKSYNYICELHYISIGFSKFNL